MMRRVLGVFVLLSLFAVLFSVAGCGQPLVNPGLKAVYPRQRMILFLDTPPGAFVPVDSLQPTLRWESFPRSRDLAGSMSEVCSQAEDVSYDLVLAEASALRNVYSRRGLKEASHRVEIPLKPKTDYLWTVRACFRLGNEPRCTQWGALSDWESQAVWHPNAFSYRLRTP